MARTIAVAVLMVALLTGCGNPTPPTASAQSEVTTVSSTSESHVLELEVTGTATLSALTFILDGQATEENAVSLPWRKTVSVPSGTGRHEWKLTMRHSGGNLSATATLDGKPLTRTSGSGSPGSDNTATLSGSFQD